MGLYEKIERKDHQFFVLILLVSLAITGSFYLSLKSLPSPIHGGDLYYHTGMAYHFFRGGSIFDNSQLVNAIPWAPFFQQYVISLLGHLTAGNMIKANLYSGILFQCLSIITVYLLGLELFGNRKVEALIFTAPFLFLMNLKYTEIMVSFVAPLVLLLLLRTIKNPEPKNFVLLGVGFGLSLITHTLGGISMALVIFVVSVFFLLFEKKEGKYSFNIKNLQLIAVTFVIGGLIGLLFWFQPVFKEHLHISNNISEYDQESYEVMLTWGYTAGRFWFLPKLNDMVDFAKLLIACTGFILIIRDKDRSREEKFLLVLLVTTLITTFHYLVTIPLINRDFFSRLIYNAYIGIPIISAAFVVGINRLVKDRRNVKLLALALLLVFSYSTFNNYIQTNQWIQVGKAELSPVFTDVADWMKENTELSDVFITTNEIGFALNGLTGSKFVASRRAHSGMFVDVDRRWTDAAIILYGNDGEKRRELLEAYNVKYLYWRYDWIQMDYTFDESGQLVNIFDPYLIRDIENYSKELDENGVEYIEINTWLDPANRRDSVKTFDALLALPAVPDYMQPWDPSLEQCLEPVKEFYLNGQLHSIMYEIKCG